MYKRKIIQYEIEDGGELLIESVEKCNSSYSSEIGIDSIINRAEKKFESALDKIKPAAQACITKLKELKDSPDEIVLEFGIKATQKGTLVIAGVEGETNFNVILKWHK